MDVFKAILDIEKKAQNVIDTFDSVTSEKTDAINNELKALEEEENKDTLTRLEEIRKQSQKELKAELEKTESLMLEKNKALEKYFSEHEKLWISEITKRITGGDML